MCTMRLEFADFPMSPKLKVGAGAIGTVQLSLSVFLFWRTHRDLGANWSPALEIGAQHTLVTRGVYGRIRHPMYASQALLALAQALLLPNW
ncbi:MAG: isoprenylcysteine carboxylmethyltransferase family protein, partial [Chloroflexi bacterium]|nr:isoprenylcysteine carboxylmethyltransferase family protein [Chloroflexota bacterium]